MIEIKHGGFSLRIGVETAKKFSLKDGQEVANRYELERILKHDREKESEAIKDSIKKSTKNEK